jgi:hypothetical protein
MSEYIKTIDYRDQVRPDGGVPLNAALQAASLVVEAEQLIEWVPTHVTLRVRGIEVTVRNRIHHPTGYERTVVLPIDGEAQAVTVARYEDVDECSTYTRVWIKQDAEVAR